MKTISILCTFFLAFLGNNVSAQSLSFEKLLETPEILTLKATPINCGSCNNKAIIPVRLPSEAKGLFYTITISPRGNAQSGEGVLLEEVSRLSKSFPLEEIVDQISTPQTVRSANIYIIRGKKYADSFMQCGFYYHHGKFIGSKSRSGYIENTEGETFYLGIERDSDWKGVQVKVELVAAI